jgi:hypothetical protein
MYEVLFSKFTIGQSLQLLVVYHVRSFIFKISNWTTVFQSQQFGSDYRTTLYTTKFITPAQNLFSGKYRWWCVCNVLIPLGKTVTFYYRSIFRSFNTRVCCANMHYQMIIRVTVETKKTNTFQEFYFNCLK